MVRYGADSLDADWLAGLYTELELLCTKPVDLPVVRSDKFDPAINLMAVMALGLAVPSPLQAQGDEVIR